MVAENVPAATDGRPLPESERRPTVQFAVSEAIGFGEFLASLFRRAAYRFKPKSSRGLLLLATGWLSGLLHPFVTQVRGGGS